MRRTLATEVLVLMLLVGGCCRPVRVETDGHLNLVMPHGVTNRIINETPPSTDAGPIVPMPLGGCGASNGPMIALLDVDGILVNFPLNGHFSLGENPLALFREKLEAIAANPNVRAVVLRINSPGGGVTTTDIMWRDLLAFRAKTGLPIVACLMDLGTGGAYYLATAADVIVAHPTTITGGLGVILNLYNLREAMARQDVFAQSIKAGPHIDMGTATRALPDDVRTMLQGMADEFQQRFRQVVLRRRPGVNPDEASTFDGRVFTAPEALERRLIDRIGYLDDAIAVARELGHADCARLVLFHRCNDPAHSQYAMTPNTPLQTTGGLLPLSVPGLERSRLPTFLYMWLPEPTMDRMGGR
jgi:protease-4